MRPLPLPAILLSNFSWPYRFIFMFICTSSIYTRIHIIYMCIICIYVYTTYIAYRLSPIACSTAGLVALLVCLPSGTSAYGPAPLGHSTNNVIRIVLTELAQTSSRIAKSFFHANNATQCFSSFRGVLSISIRLAEYSSCSTVMGG